MPVPGSFGTVSASHASRSAGCGSCTTSSARLSRSSGPRSTKQIVAELIDDVFDDAVVGGGGRAQHRDARREEVEHAGDAPVVGPEVVAPVADAVRLVDHEQADARGDQREHVVAEARVRESLGRDEQQVDLVALERLDDPVPVVGVVARDASGRARRRARRHRSGCASATAGERRAASGRRPRSRSSLVATK